MSMGTGTKIGKELSGFIGEIEGVRERKKQLGEAEKAIFADAKAKGFDVKTMRRLLVLRTQKASDRQEAEALLDTYMHAIGMADEPPLFVAMGKVGVDLAARAEAVEFLKSIVPPLGEIVLKLGGVPVRVYRDKDGEAQAEDVVDEPPPPKPHATAADEKDDGASYAPAHASRTLPRSHVTAAADRAEAAADAKRKREAATT